MLEKNSHTISISKNEKAAKDRHSYSTSHCLEEIGASFSSAFESQICLSFELSVGLYILLSHLVISPNSRTIKSFIILQWSSYFLKLFFSGKWGIIRLLGNLQKGSLQQGTYKMNGLNHPSPQSGLRHSGRTAGSAAPAQPGITCMEKQKASVLKYPACYSSENRAP